MKKSAWVVVGLLVVIGAGLLIGRQKTQGTQETPQLGTGQVEQVAESNDQESEKSVEDPRDFGVDESSLDADRQTGKSAPQLSDAVKALVGLDGKEHNYQTLLKAIGELGYELSDTEVVALREMLTWPNDRFPEKMKPIGINAIKNDVLDKLLRQKELPAGLGLQMVEMANNPENDPVWRDYCVQFMEPFYERAAGETDFTTEGTEEHGGGTSANSVSSSAAGGENDELAVIRDAMFSALDERDSTIAGTSLIGLENLSRTHDEFDREAIVEKASEIALDETASAASRLTALRLAAGRPPEGGTTNGDVQEAARSIAQTGETVLLRSAAIVTLGEVGTSDDRELLESFLLDGNKQISDAARMALTKMDSEQSHPAEPINQVISSETTTSQSTEKKPPILIN